MQRTICLNSRKITNIINLLEKYNASVCVLDPIVDQNDPTNSGLDVAVITAPEKRTQTTIDKLKSLKSQLAKSLKTSSLYDSALFTKQLEDKYLELCLK